MYNVDFFRDELKLIKDPVLRFVTKKALEAAPAWFWTAPASTSGKFHPPDSNGEGGTVRHTAKVIWLAYKYSECFPHIDSDVMVVGAALHDYRKFGTNDEIDFTDYKMHAELGATMLLRRFPEFSKEADQLHPDQLRNKWEAACSLIRTHMGRWGTCKPLTLEQRLLHIADVTASHKELVAVKFYDPDRPVEAPAQTSSYERLIEKNGETYINFGKHHGKLIKSIVENDPSYTKWILSDKYDKEDVKGAFTRAMESRGELGANSGKMPIFK